ncbi:PREDICTED: replication protein A 70 kDa DNA-binding subunit C-like [Camelina sativa]|uniref:Replication protein A 70 kDa DNA-binding subunit C-like n=1 Tax=Camelina sativa TaxID=90675 RepID=A0ABM0XEM5_CAMSA|nr:PREDICTED: replication protein A 70 kDa DNA-binding subunit C-like [Camelina sativa]
MSSQVLLSLSPSRRLGRYKSKIVHSWRQYTSSSGETLEVIFADVDGTLIHATIKKNQVNKFFRMIVAGEWRIIENFQLTKSMGKYRATNHAFKMSLTNSTIISRSPALSDDWYFDFKSFDEITAEGDLSDNILIDVVGQVVNIGAMITHDVNGKITKRLEVVLRDTSDNRLPCTLWGRFADIMWSACEQAGNQMVTCLLRLAKINTFNGVKSISNAYNMSLLIINPDYPAVQDFSARLPRDEVTIAVLQPKPVGPKNDTKVDYFNRVEKKTISEFLETTAEGKFKIFGTIFNIDMDYGWYYFTCVKCDKTAYLVPKKEDDAKSKIKTRLFSCKKCNEITSNVLPRFRLILSVMDHSAHTKVMLFDNNAEKIVNKTAKEILDGHHDEIQDPTNVPEVLKSLVGKTFQFLASVEIGNLNGGNDTYKVSYVEVGSETYHVDNIEDSEQTLDLSAVVSNDQVEIDDGIGTSNTTPSSKRKEGESDDLLEQSSSSKKFCVKSIGLEIEKEADEEDGKA